MANLKIIPPENIDFESYKEKLKDYLRSQHQFSDYDFEGSNISILLNLLARNTYYNGIYLNMVGSEMFLDSSEIRSSVVSHAKELNYVPRSRSSARCFAEIEVVPNNSPNRIIIPRFYRFRTTNVDGKTVFFSTDQEYLAVRDTNGRYIFENVELFEGEVVVEYFNVNAIDTSNNFVVYKDRFVISSENVDISSIEVFVAETNSGEYTSFERVENLYNLDENSNIYFIEGYSDNQYEIVFGDGVLGKSLSVNNSIMVRYRNTLGSEIRGNYVFTPTGNIQGYSDINITTTSRVEGGAERESTDSIKYIAPRFYQTQDRAVVDSDYETLILKNFPTIQKVNVFGGEEIYQYGKVMVVLKPFGNNGLVSTQTKRQIIAYLKPKNIVPEVVILDPDYYYLGIEGNVYYNNPITKTVESSLETAIKTNLEETNNTILGDFNTTIYQSVVNEIIKGSDSYIAGSDVTLSMYKEWNPVLGVRDSLTFSTNNPIFKPTAAYTDINHYSVISTPFSIIYNDQIIDIILQDDGIGNLYRYSVDISGNKTKLIEPVGTIDYATGSVNATLDVYNYLGRGISFKCSLVNDSVYMERDKFMIVDPTYIDITIKSK